MHGWPFWPTPVPKQFEHWLCMQSASLPIAWRGLTRSRCSRCRRRRSASRSNHTERNFTDGSVSLGTVTVTGGLW